MNKLYNNHNGQLLFPHMRPGNFGLVVGILRGTATTEAAATILISLGMRA